jgi:hypothetical protein
MPNYSGLFRYISVLITIFIIISSIPLSFPERPSVYQVSAASEWKQTSHVQFWNGTTAYIEVNEFWNDAYLSLTYIEDDWTETTPSISPDIEHSHAMAAVYGTDNIILFGGFNGSYSNDTWVYDHSDELWNQTNISVRPEGRLNHAMAPIDGTDKILMFGGYTGVYEDDTWIYDYSDNSWTELNPSNKPLGRQEHSLASIWGTDKVLLFGGHNGIIYGDTWLFDLSSNSWIKLTTSGSPEPRYSHATASAWGTDSVVLFGGWNNQKLADTWIFNLGDNSWTENVQESIPYPRMDHTLVSLHGTDSVVLYSGDATTSDGNPWIYDLSANSWTNKILWPCPTSRYLHAMANVWNTDEIVLFSGDFFIQYEDTWVLDINPYNNNGSYISESYDIGSDAVMQTLSWDGVTSSESELLIQLRSAPTEFDLTLAKFLGPDGTTTSFYTNSPSIIWSGHADHRWIQYKVFMSTDDLYETPRLNEIKIQFNKMPTVEDTAPLNGTIFDYNTQTFTWNFSDLDSISQSAFQVQIDDDDNFTSVDYDSTEQGVAELYWNFPERTNYTTISDGKWYWRVRVKDNDGTWSRYSSSLSFYIDTHNPISEIGTPQNGSSHNSCDLISGTASDTANGTDLDRVEIQIQRTDNNFYWDGSIWDIPASWLETSGNSSWSYDTSTINWPSGVRYIVNSRAIDVAGNIELRGEGLEFIVDKTAPVSSIDSPLNDAFLNGLEMINGDAYDTDGSEVNFVEISMECNEDNTYWNGTNWVVESVWQIADGTGPWNLSTLDVGFITDRHYTITSRAVDRAGNIELSKAGIKFLYDNIPPDELAISINGDDSYTNSTEIDLQLDAEDSGSDLYLMAFSTDGSKWSSWKKYNQSYTTIIPSGDGLKTVYYMVQDRAGNIAISVNDTIILDTTAPTGLTVSINDGSGETDDPFVILTLNATDSASGVYQMSFSTDGSKWTDWEFYSETKAFGFSGDTGLKMIYFKVQDSVGNIAVPATASVIYSTGPEPLINDKDIDTDEKSFLSNFMFLIPFIMIIIILIIAVLIYTVRRRKKTKTLRPEIEYLPPVERETKVIDAETVELDRIEDKAAEGDLDGIGGGSGETVDAEDVQTSEGEEPRLLASAPEDVEKIEELFDFSRDDGETGEEKMESSKNEDESKPEPAKGKVESQEKPKSKGKSKKSKSGRKPTKSLKSQNK